MRSKIWKVSILAVAITAAISSAFVSAAKDAQDSSNNSEPKTQWTKYVSYDVPRVGQSSLSGGLSGSAGGLVQQSSLTSYVDPSYYYRAQSLASGQTMFSDAAPVLYPGAGSTAAYQYQSYGPQSSYGPVMSYSNMMGGFGSQSAGNWMTGSGYGMVSGGGMGAGLSPGSPYSPYSVGGTAPSYTSYSYSPGYTSYSPGYGPSYSQGYSPSYGTGYGPVISGAVSGPGLVPGMGYPGVMYSASSGLGTGYGMNGAGRVPSASYGYNGYGISSQGYMPPGYPAGAYSGYVGYVGYAGYPGGYGQVRPW